MIKRALLVLPLALAAWSCSKSTEGLDDAGTMPPDGGTIVKPDAGSVADAGAEPEAARHLIQLDLFGSMPLDNAVVDPQLDPSSQSWLAVGDLQGQGRFVRAQFRELARTPAGLPALLLPARDMDPPDTVLLGSVSAAGAPLTASVWIGRASEDSAALTEAHPFLIATLADDGVEQAFDLVPDTGTATVSLDGLGWQKYSATVTETSVGILTFAVDDRVHLPLYVHAPVVLSRIPLRLAAPIARARLLTARERQAAKMIADWRRRRLGEAKEKVEPVLSPAVMKAVLSPAKR